MPHCGIVQTVTSNGERLKWGKGVHSRLAHRSRPYRCKKSGAAVLLHRISFYLPSERKMVMRLSISGRISSSVFVPAKYAEDSSLIMSNRLVS